MARKTAKSRRGRGEGGIRFREEKNLWEARLSLGYGPDGKRVRKTVYGADKAEVSEKLRKLQADHDAGRLVETEEITTREYLTRWLNNTAKESVGVATWERYRQLVEIYLVPILGGVKLHKLRPLHVEQCYAAMKDGTADRKPAGADTRKSAGVILSAALKHAVQMKLIPHNPAADVKKAKPAVREMAFLTQPQAKRWLTTAKRNQNYALFAAALGSGARQGELLGLTWPDLDLERGTLDVRRALAQVKGKFILKEPKSRTSRRTITLPTFAVDALRDHRAAALKGGRITGPVFCTRTMGYLDRKNVLRACRTITTRTNEAEQGRAVASNEQPDLIPQSLRFHDLRHTHATGLIAAGSSIKAISRRLGHSDISITLKVYGHLLPDDDEKLAGQANALFG
ncbi:phage integrase : Integrase family protein OS=Nitrolancea hollandica Lb GN=NITHO_2230014 PE=4 SV=1: Phage_int_SAM_3: Phage_integrase [Gemmata massiliana]|uniref:Tyr recombinase domain-containing protein n=1 Tax=Gemmata massiliana TaxID=1210884 RepID=A0A6P2CYX5_9BACT|nr:site-specific integrase [Gemmata massiliana]VTR94063.1 phage integrase : Integrase family protein OS=Nitrolancea hollandica Lb GN=NITHO_2230014 PE=4 SV=1: Phage_int_SAM_3: Phage_integrase [Gemmata massiliana]